MTRKILTVAAWGGGVNSTAMLIRWIAEERGIDLVMFADTGGERPGTYAHRDTFFAWLKERGVACFTVYGNYKYTTLEAECLGSKTLPSLAYGWKRCSLKWKRQPQDAFLNQHAPAKVLWKSGGRVTKLIGYDAGEERRAKIKDDKKYTYTYPLIDWGVDRDGCLEIIDAAGLEVPGKSACFFCPASRVGDILDLGRDHPELMRRAIQIEDNAELVTVKGLGRRFAWRDLLNQETKQQRLFPDETVPCDCFDG